MPWLRSLFEWVDTFESSIAIREGLTAFPTLLTIHVVGMCIFAGLVIMMDLRLLGVGNMRTPFTQVQRRLFPWQVVGMLVSAATGLALLYGQPMRYYVSVYFWLKTMMMVLASVNALAFHHSIYNSVGKWDSAATVPYFAKLAAIISLALWAAVIMTGRLMAYNWFNPA